MTVSPAHLGLLLSMSVITMHKSASPTSPVVSNLESSWQVHGKGCEGFNKVIDQHPEEDTKCL